MGLIDNITMEKKLIGSFIIIPAILAIIAIFENVYIDTLFRTSNTW